MNVNLLENLDKPKWLQSHEDSSYITLMGSRAYNTFNENSDWDYYGFVLPPIEVLFPHLQGEILGFGRNIQRFEQVQFDHVPAQNGNSKFDLTIYNIVKYFQLAMMGNPNLVDSLFVPEECIIHQDEIGKMVRNNKRLFLSQKCWHTYKGMLFSHLSRIKSNHIKEGRIENANRLKLDFDPKDAYHCIRMILEMSQILYTGNLILNQDSKILLEIRNGEWAKQQVIEMCEKSLLYFEENQDSFIVPYSPDENKIKKLLVICLEAKFGSLSKYGYGII